MALREIMHSPRIYDAVQAAAGAGKVRERLRVHTAAFDGMRVLDVGAGTGGYVGVVHDPADYLAVDLDEAQLERLHEKWPGVRTMLADATRLDLSPGSFDHGLCTFLVHHLDDEGLARFTASLRGILCETLILVDPLRIEGRLRSRLLWAIDRGSYPRSADEVLGALDRDFTIEHQERFAIHHEYLLCVARPRR